MTLDEIIAALERAPEPSEATLRSAMPHAAALAPAVFEKLEQLGRGVCLLPEDRRLLLFGLHVLAAARHEKLWAKLVELARADGDDLDDLFEGLTRQPLAALMLGVWDGDVDALLKLIELGDVADEPRCALLDVLARLTFDGRIPRAKTAEFLKHLAQAEAFDEESGAWEGWADALARLGLTELEDELEDVWNKEAFEHYEADEISEINDLLRLAASDLSNPSHFDEAGLRPFDDPHDGLKWLRDLEAEHREMMAGLGVDEPNDLLDDDPGKSIRPSTEETAWLDRFLESRHVPPTAMSYEMMDGYLTAIAVGPSPKMSPDGLQVVWSDEGRTEPSWDSDRQRDYACSIVRRSLEAMLARRKADAPHTPFIMPIGDAGEAWAEGFLLAVEKGQRAWQPLVDHRRGFEALDRVALLAGDVGESSVTTLEEREAIIDALPETLRRIAAFWRDPAAAFPGQTPVRVQKVGRNEPCPCGSGKKYKRCCGQAA